MSENILVTPDQLHKMMTSLPTVIIDTRAPEAYAAGHILGAANIHDIITCLATSSKEGLEELRGKFFEAFQSFYSCCSVRQGLLMPGNHPRGGGLWQ